MSSNNIEDIVSPCIGVCAMSEVTGQCLGCYRTIDEIRNWWDMTPEERQGVMGSLEQREVESDAKLFGN